MATKDISVIRDKKTGDIKNIRDKEIKDAKAKTAVAQTDAVRMKTVDNKEVYIDRNSLVQAIAEVMNSNSKSTIQTLFGADANGNHANINMANLASVLSAESSEFRQPIDYNNLKTPGAYYIYDAAQSTSSNRPPSGDGGIIEVRVVYPYIKQEFLDNGNDKKYYRQYNMINGAWGVWKYITLTN